MTEGRRDFLVVLGTLLAVPAVFVAYRSCQLAPVPAKSGLTQISLQDVKTSQQVQRVEHKRRQVRRSQRTREVVVTRRYHPETGKLVAETLRKREEHSQQAQEATRSLTLTGTGQSHTVNQQEAAPTGLTAGVLGTSAGVGLTAGVTLLALPPLSLEAQAGVLVVPQPAPVLGLAVHGTVAPRLVAGVGVYLGPYTALGYTPVPGLPVSVQPGLSLQYRF